MKHPVIFRVLALVLALSLLPVPVWAAGDTGDAPAEYEALFPISEHDVSTPVFSSGVSADNLLRGKSIMFFGDSLTTGYGLSSYDQTWCAMLGSRYGMDVTCNSISGSTFGKSATYGYKPGGCFEPYVDRALPSKSFDVIFVEGGGNDCYCQIPLGSNLDSRDPYTFAGAVNVVIDRLTAAYPEALILFMTPWRGSDPVTSLTENSYYDILTEICARRNIPCFQGRDPEVSGIHSRDASFRKSYHLTANDYWHLNAAGQALFLPTIAGWLESQVLEHRMVGGFYDVPRDAWFAAAVAYAQQTGLVSGVDTAHFAPDLSATRGMLAAILYRNAGKPLVTGLSSPFADVQPGSYYRDAIVWCYHGSIVAGISEDAFAPDQVLTRQELAAILYRTAVSPPSGEAPPGDIPENLLSYTDCGEISPYARRAMSWAVETGLLVGPGDQTLAPAGETTRAQLVAVLQRYFSKFS